MTSSGILDLLRRYESRNVTYVDPDGLWPIVWQRARGVHVWDLAGRKYLDLTGAFGVAAAGHANQNVVRAGQRQMATLLHAMGDVHPHPLKAQLARELSRITFERWSGFGASHSALGSQSMSVGRTTTGLSPSDGQRVAGGRVRGSGFSGGSDSRAATGKTIFCNSGFEAVEAALKTAMLATGRPGVIAFEGAYHGLGYGALNATHRHHFRGPFRSQLREFGSFLPFPQAGAGRKLASPRVPTLAGLEKQLRALFRHRKIGAVLVEPIQVRGGVNVPPAGFLPMLRAACKAHDALLIVDEIYTGFGRTGKWFACEHAGVAPDIICLGKALTGGFPLSACVGRADVMDAAWPLSTGEAIHTSTFLGHPVGCAMALAQIREIRRLRLPERAAKTGAVLSDELTQLARATTPLRCSARGQGLLAGLELTHVDGSPATAETLALVKRMLHAGFILLPEGEHANVISFTPPLTISEPDLRRASRQLSAALFEIVSKIP